MSACTVYRRTGIRRDTTCSSQSATTSRGIDRRAWSGRHGDRGRFLQWQNWWVPLHNSAFATPICRRRIYHLFFRQFQKQNLHSAFWRRSAQRGL